MAKTANQVGSFLIKRRERFQSGSRDGMRPGWTEYQVWQGRGIVSRHDTFGQATEAAFKLLNAFWDEQSRHLKAMKPETDR